ncbi:coleoptile phototropism protein 1-like [Oryza brachyantha]|uniref:coleoptile phototropism protein 1-like n=1 Tax=Oryza brachyantha TaxID=4533 RepID=UPI001AD96DD3|nr:coleoptile phototropism protein 1-like [Oryza brachyantha]
MKASSQSQSQRTPSPRAAAGEHTRSSSEPWLVAAAAASTCDDSCVNDVENFARTVAAAKSRMGSSSSSAAGAGAASRPDMLASVLSHYAAKWLPDVAAASSSSPASSASGRFLPPESPTATWLKKRLLLESLVAALPPDPAPGGGVAADDGITCDFLLKLLRAGSMVGADAALLQELESRASRRLDQATLGAVMIPAFGHEYACGTLLDVPLVLRLVRGFLKDGGGAAATAKAAGGGAAAARVARLVDAYLAEAALEAGLRPAEFEELARAVPAHARPADDALYRAVDTYLKAHPSTSKEERKSLCRLIDARKLTAEAAAHAVQNDRLPVRTVLQVLFSEHGKLNRLAELSGGGASFGAPSPAFDLPGARCPSKREMLAQHHEVRRLREDFARLQVQCGALQAQVDRLSTERRRRGGGGGGFFKWSTFWFGGMSADVARVEDSESGMERRTPVSGKKGRAATATPTPKWRKSMS